MGFGFGKIGGKIGGFLKRGIGNIFSKQGLMTAAGAGLGFAVGGPIGAGIGAGAGLATGSQIKAQENAMEEAKNARDQAQKQYAAEEAALKAAADEAERLELEKRKKLIAAGQANPATMMSGYTGLPGSANVIRNFLG